MKTHIIFSTSSSNMWKILSIAMLTLIFNWTPGVASADLSDVRTVLEVHQEIVGQDRKFTVALKLQNDTVDQVNVFHYMRIYLFNGNGVLGVEEFNLEHAGDILCTIDAPNCSGLCVIPVLPHSSRVLAVGTLTRPLTDDYAIHTTARSVIHVVMGDSFCPFEPQVALRAEAYVYVPELDENNFPQSILGEIEKMNSNITSTHAVVQENQDWLEQIYRILRRHPWFQPAARHPQVSSKAISFGAINAKR